MKFSLVVVDLFQACPLLGEGVFFKDMLHPNWVGQVGMAEAFFAKCKEKCAARK